MTENHSNDWVEQGGFYLQMWELPKLGRVVLFKPSEGAQYLDGYLESGRYVAKFDRAFIARVRIPADTWNWFEAHRLAHEAIISYQRKLELGECADWGSADWQSPSNFLEGDEVNLELLTGLGANDELDNTGHFGSIDIEFEARH